MQDLCEKQINVAILGAHFIWSGGVDLICNISKALALKAETLPLKIFLLFPDKLPEQNIISRIKRQLRPYKKLFIELIKNKRFFLPFNEYIMFKYGYKRYYNLFNNLGIEMVIHKNNRDDIISCLKRINADVVLPIISGIEGVELIKYLSIPWIGYVYDFQHKYYPDFFSDNTRLSRDKEFACVLQKAKTVIVNSNSVKNDINKFFPDYKCPIFTLPFTPIPEKTWLEEILNSSDKIKKKYKLPQKYFLICNQFWVHKSHTTAFEALNKLKTFNCNDDIHIVCTGNTCDSRFPDYFIQLKEKIKELKLSDKIHFLGYISKIEQISIMAQSIAVLQPTLFEGGPGGGSVYDALSIGIPCIISDIPVNTEIEEENVFFFKTGSAKDMAEKMVRFSNTHKSKLDSNILISRGNKYAAILGDKLLEVIYFVLNN